MGDVADKPLFSIARWFMRFTQLLGRERDGDEPMFLSRDMVRPYTYPALTSDLHAKLDAVGANTKLGPHGLRVAGYNNTCETNGKDITVAHGGWSGPESSDRYARFLINQALAIPANMVGGQHSFGGNTRAISRDRVVRGTLPPEEDFVANDSADEDSRVPSPLLPVDVLPSGFTCTVKQKSTSGQSYKVYTAPDGKNLYSRVTAWDYYFKCRSVDASSDAAAATPSGAAAAASSHTPSSRTALRRTTPNRRVPSSPLTPRPVPTESDAPPATAPAPARPEFLHEIVVEKDRPPSRRVPARRGGNNA